VIKIEETTKKKRKRTHKTSGEHQPRVEPGLSDIAEVRGVSAREGRRLRDKFGAGGGPSSRRLDGRWVSGCEAEVKAQEN
jgi:hypothetical protein